MRPGNQRRRILLADLEGSVIMRRLVRWMATTTVRRWQSSPERRASVCVLVHAPSGRAADLGWHAGVRVVRPADVLSTDLVRQAHRWAYEASLDIVYGRGRQLFPEVLGVHLGELNLLRIQMYLSTFRLLSTALNVLLEGGDVAECRVLSGDRSMARALCAEAGQQVANVSMWSPALLKRLADAPRRYWASLRAWSERDAGLTIHPRVLDMLGTSASDSARAKVLIVSESVPMAQMFEVLESRLREAEVGPVVRLQFGGQAGAVEQTPSATIRYFRQPGTSHWGEETRVRRQLRDVRRRCLERLSDTADTAAELASGWPLGTLLEHLYDAEFDRQAGHVYLADALLEALRPEVLVVGNDRWWVGQAFVRRARLRAIPSVVVQDGIAPDIPGWWWLTADCIAASGNSLARMLMQRGVAPERCVVTGQPRYDALCRHGGASAVRETRAALGLSQAGYHVLFATQPHQYAEYVRDTVAAILEVPEVHVLLRPHPSERSACHEQLLRAFPRDRISLHATENILDLVRACDALVTQYSTVALEAAVLGKPVLTANFTGLPDPLTYAELGIVATARTASELSSTLRHLVASRQTAPVGARPSPGALTDLIGPVDGKAGERVASLIAAMLGHRAETVPIEIP